MRIRTALLAAVLVAAPALASSPASANHLCVHYEVTAPVVGTNQGTPCSPVGIPGPNYKELGNCQNVPPAGLRVCAVVMTHTP